MSEERLILIDIDVMHWKVGETRAYRAAVGVNPEYALGVIMRASEEAAAEIKTKFGDEQPPPEYMPLPMLSVDPMFLLGFAWVTARRSDPALTFDAYAEDIETGQLMEAFYGASAGQVDDEGPFETPPKQAAKPSASKTRSRSASSSAGA
jgi:hypothetical protein